MQQPQKVHAFLWNMTGVNNCNTFLFTDTANILIDPGHAGLFGNVRDGLSRLGLSLGAIDLVICTHAHPDHVEAVHLFKAESVPVAYHAADWEMVRAMQNHLSARDGDIEKMAPDLFLQSGELTIKDLTLEIIHTPGHSPGSICVYWPAERTLACGDLVFERSIGRTDLPGGDPQHLKESITRLAGTPSDHLLPGHGEPLHGESRVADNYRYIQEVWFPVL